MKINKRGKNCFHKGENNGLGMFQDKRQAQGRSWARTDLGLWRADGSQWGGNIVSAGKRPRGGRRDTQGLAHMGLVSHETALDFTPGTGIH